MSTVNDVRPGENATLTVAIKKCVVRPTRSGNKFATLTLADRTGSIDAVVWEDAEQFADDCPPGTVIQVTGPVQDYEGRSQLNAKQYRVIPEEEVDPVDFLPAADESVDSMWDELVELIDSINNKWLKRLLEETVLSTDLAENMRRAPGAMTVHHDYVGGLLEHSASVALLCDAAARHYPNVDRDLVVTGGILHDIGKIEEYSIGTTIGFTDEGQLLGHIVLGDRLVARAIDRIDGFPEKLALRIRHIIISHHGQVEWGSPKVPATIESLIIHHLENMDAKVAVYTSASQETQDGRWTKPTGFPRQSFLVEPIDEGSVSVTEGPEAPPAVAEVPVDPDPEQETLDLG